jgi:UDP:flavonoid glycosyltransferase YjiC (YdhE family)
MGQTRPVEVPLRSQARRVLVTSLPWLSHFLAQLPLARAMADAGHEVRFATSEVLGPTVRRAGFAVIPVPMQRKERTGKELTVPVGGAYGGFAYLEHAAWGAPALLEAFEQWCPDVVVRDPLELGSCLAAERAGIPHAVGREGPFWPVELRRSTLSGLDDLRRQLGLPADPMVEAPYR